MDVVRGYLQTYDWGMVNGLSPWVGVTDTPQAELWFGTHPNGASPGLDGPAPARRQLPLLAKLLAAGRPLSIQIHPPQDLAEQWFRGQQSDPDAPRLLSDPYGKTEILIALEPFDILEGFRDPGESAKILAGLGTAMQPAAAALRCGDIAGSVTALLALPSDAVTDNAPKLPWAMRKAGLSEHSQSVMSVVVDNFAHDAGVFVAALLESRRLNPAEAVYVEPGTVHAYVRGLGVEVMTNSDNVLRLGLTSKPVAVTQALQAVDIDAQPHPCEPQQRAGVRTYAPPGGPFSVTMVTDAPYNASGGAARIVVCLSGVAQVGHTHLRPGQAALFDAQESAVEVVAQGQTFVAEQAPAISPT